MFDAGVPYGQISAVLAATAVLNWLLFDGTPQGLVLASLCAVGAPTSELLLMKVFGVWHYERPGPRTQKFCPWTLVHKRLAFIAVPRC